MNKKRALLKSLIFLLTSITLPLYTLDGELDPTFGNQGVVTNTFHDFDNKVRGVISTPTGILCALGGTVQESIPFMTVACYQPNGLPDTTFNSQGFLMTTCGAAACDGYGIMLDNQQNILGVGSAQTNEGASSFSMVRILSNGTLDKTFNKQGSVLTHFNGAHEVAYTVGQAHNKIYVAGTSDGSLALACYTVDGVLDTSFGQGGTLLEHLAYTVYSVSDIIIQPDGKIVVGGTFTTPEKFFIVRYTQTGTLDASFNASGSQPGILISSFGGSYDSMESLVIQPDLKFVVGGSTASGVAALALARYTNSGLLDTSFNPHGAVPGITITPISRAAGQINALTLEPDGKIVAAGLAQFPRGIFVSVIARYDSTGVLDSSFNAGSTTPGIFLLENIPHVHLPFSSTTASAVTLQEGGKIVVAGDALMDEASAFMILRLFNNSTQTEIL